MTDYTKVTLDIDRDRYTGGIQVLIGVENDEGVGHGYRLAGPKCLGDSTSLKRVTLTEDDARQIRRYLDTIYPAAVAGSATPTCDCDEFPYHGCPIHGDQQRLAGSATPEEDTHHARL